MKTKPRKTRKLPKRDLKKVATLMRKYGITKGEAITMHVRSGL